MSSSTAEAVDAGRSSPAGDALATPAAAATERAADAGVRSSLHARLILIAVAGGIVFRVAQYLSRQSFWGDEAALLLNLRHRSWSEVLFQRLDFTASTQAAPPAFLAVLKAIVEAGGESEYAMRLVPLAMSVLGLIFFAVLAMKIAPMTAAAWAVGFFALSDVLILQAATMKQYSGDVLIAVLLLLVAFGWKGASAARRLVVVSLLSAGAVWLSHATVFIYGGIALALLPDALRERKARAVACAFASGLLFLISFALLYHFSITRQRDPFLDEFWVHGFAPQRITQLPRWIVKQFWEVFSYPIRPVSGALLVAAVIGVVSMWRENRRTLAIALASPFLLLLLAALLGRYPLAAQRITLFLVPLQFLLAGIGIEAMCRLWRNEPGLRGAIVVAAGCVVAVALARAGVYLVTPQRNSHVRQAVEHVRAQHKPSEPVLVHGNNASAILRCYWREADAAVIHDPAPDDARDRPAFWIVTEEDADASPVRELSDGGRLDEAGSRRLWHGSALRYEPPEDAAHRRGY